MSDLVYPPVIALAKTLFRVLDVRITVEGSHHVPVTGGAVIASNHVSYLDFIFCGLGANESGRLVRFMAKQSIFAHRVGGPLMRGMHHIPVDREAGLASYKAALEALKAGEVVGVFPEATISQSFTVKEIKSGAARMAAATGVPLVPLALWGTQRLWTKGHKRDLTQRHIPISIIVGEPLYPTRQRQGGHDHRRAALPDAGAARPRAAELPDAPRRAGQSLVAAGPPGRHRTPAADPTSNPAHTGTSHRPPPGVNVTTTEPTETLTLLRELEPVVEANLNRHLRDGQGVVPARVRAVEPGPRLRRRPRRRGLGRRAVAAARRRPAPR